MSEELSKSQLKKQKKLQEREARKQQNKDSARLIALPEWLLARFKPEADSRIQLGMIVGLMLYEVYSASCSLSLSGGAVYLMLDDTVVCEIQSANWPGIQWSNTVEVQGQLLSRDEMSDVLWRWFQA